MKATDVELDMFIDYLVKNFPIAIWMAVYLDSKVPLVAFSAN